MKKHILDRYGSLPDGRFLVDVAAGDTAGLFEEFDRAAPYYRKDLDPQLAEYLCGCVREIGRAPFALRFSFDRAPDEAARQRIRKSVRSYFLYRGDIESENMARLLRSSLLLGTAGVLLLAVTVLLRTRLQEGGGLLPEIAVEGATIAAWVALWEALARLLLRWGPGRKEREVCRRLADADVLFRS
ncbi:hypothetical protein CHL67_10100 [Prosthecochloris sp. GSB1]|uniref:hypothetical protein n=1 Tax=Prosthecochloris sp. GSB1 TaxID=281093 RepID=UPI000B8CC25E|nr:hypothetical protein [Prosthecochloris sp. GSB1]ASQ91215.1 hypothetical protein CHL67_10100 [Prosthecochloris sp. GSB1]